MASKKVKIELDLNARDAQRALKDAASDARDLDSDLGDVESAGAAVARAIEASADDMIREIDDTARAVQALERALGPDFDGDTREVVADLKRVGLTADDVEADADELAAALRRAGDVKVHAVEAGFDDVGQAVGSVRDETGRAKDSMHGFVGGAVGELPLISDAMGPVGEGLGQLTEGALEGQISLKQMAGAGLAMGGVALVLSQVQGHFAEIAKIKAWKTEQVEDLADAIAEADSAAEGLRDTLNSAGAIEVQTALNGIVDITPVLARAGITVDDWTEAVQGGSEAADELGIKLKGAGVGGEDAINVLNGLSNAQGLVEEATDLAAERTKVFGDENENAAEAVEENTDAVDDLTDSLNDQVDALNDANDALVEQSSAQRGAADAAFALRDAEDKLAEELATVSDRLTEAKGDARAQQQVLDDVAEAAIGTADAQVRLAEETAIAAGDTYTATQRQDDMNTSLLETAKSAKGEARNAILKYIGSVNGIPADKMTDIQAAIDHGDIATANRLLGDASRTRTAAVKADANDYQIGLAEQKLDHLARDRSTTISVRKVSGNSGNVFFAKGTGGAPGGSAIVGEQGPEEIELPRGSIVRDAGSTKKRAMARGNAPTVVNNYFPPGVRPDDVARATRRYNDIQGPL